MQMCVDASALDLSGIQSFQASWYFVNNDAARALGSVRVCLFGQLPSNETTIDPYISCVLVHLDPIRVKFDGQSHRPKLGLVDCMTVK